MKYEGFIAKINSKSGNTNGKSWTVYSAKVEKADGTEYDGWVSLGFDKPKFEEGDYVSFETNKDKQGREVIVAGSGRKPKNPPARTAKTRQSGASGGGKFDGSGIQNRTNPVDAARMAYANARSTAVDVVGLLLTNGALPVSKASTRGAEAKRFDEITQAINKLTVQYFNDGSTLRLLDSVADAGDKVAAPAAELPTAEPREEASDPIDEVEEELEEETDDRDAADDDEVF